MIDRHDRRPSWIRFRPKLCGFSGGLTRIEGRSQSDADAVRYYLRRDHDWPALAISRTADHRSARHSRVLPSTPTTASWEWFAASMSGENSQHPLTRPGTTVACTKATTG